MAAHVIPFAMQDAGDASGLLLALQHGAVAEARHMTVLAKIPGPATLNDSARELSQTVFCAALRAAAVLDRTQMILSVGCEGIGAAGGWLLTEDGADHTGPARLRLGVGRSPDIPMADRGTLAHAHLVADATAVAMVSAGLDAAAVRLVLVKSPVRRDQAEATGRSRGAAALGVAMALGEAPRDAGPDAHSTRCMAMSGTETAAAEILVLGNRPGAGGDLVIGSAVLSDLIDIAGMRAMLRNVGTVFDAEGVATAPPPLVLFKAGLQGDGRLRGRMTHIVGTDLPADKHLRAAASGILAAIIGPAPAFISGGAERQGPPGSCLMAAIARAA